MERVDCGQIGVRDAAAWLELSERQLRRLLATFRNRGADGLAHGNRGRRPRHALSPAIRVAILDLAAGSCAGCTARKISEVLRNQSGISVSRASVQRVLAAATATGAQVRRESGRLKDRNHYPQEGMLLRLTASQRRWLESHGTPIALLAAVDDATGRVAGALFHEGEDVEGYFLLLRQVVGLHGRPLALTGAGTLLTAETVEAALVQDRAGAMERGPEQFRRLLQELTILFVNEQSEPGPASSRAANVPVLSANGARRTDRPATGNHAERLSDRPSEPPLAHFTDFVLTALRSAGATNVDEANSVLAQALACFNAQCCGAAAAASVAYRPLPPELNLNDLFCFKYRRPVTADNTIWIANRCLQLLPSNGRTCYTRAQVEVRESLSGSLSIYLQGQRIPLRERPLLRARYGRLIVSTASGSLGDRRAKL